MPCPFLDLWTRTKYCIHILICEGDLFTLNAFVIYPTHSDDLLDSTLPSLLQQSLACVFLIGRRKERSFLCILAFDLERGGGESCNTCSTLPQLAGDDKIYLVEVSREAHAGLVGRNVGR